MCVRRWNKGVPSSVAAVLTRAAWDILAAHRNSDLTKLSGNSHGTEGKHAQIGFRPVIVSSVVTVPPPYPLPLVLDWNPQ